ncbi:hypothetical protein DFH08DRAFT_38045 [Mycena albidolilacea]|uniref:Protein CPL1-like domain-containing protein n=1 Tax=Mycena albidolilacea TaxID=1033008 RepID=A0AAD7AWJ2_9AGAR|nr:hypothetical protein DFH08DRAFT_38045 [Mycena albidolilacea]
MHFLPCREDPLQRTMSSQSVMPDRTTAFATTGQERMPEGLTSCPVPGRSFGGWDCIDTRSDLESCGGCMYSVSSETAGQDCTALLGVADVSCIKGQCAVRKCMLGYKLYEDRRHCVESEGLFNQLFRI